MGATFAELTAVFSADTAGFDRGVAKVNAGVAEGSGALSKVKGTAASAVSALSKVGGATVLAAVGVGVESLKMASDFQKSTTLLQTAGGELPANMGMVRDGIQKIARQTGTSISQLAEGMYIIEKAGYRGANGLKVLHAASEGAAAEGVPMETFANALTSMMRSYNMTAVDAVKATNQIVAAGGLSKTTMAEFAGSLASVLPIASSAKISFAEVGGSIAAMTQHGTTAREATQELANTIRNLTAPNAVATKALQQMGLSATDVSANLGSSKTGLVGTINELVSAVAAHMGPAGLIVQSTFQNATTATKNARTELAAMPADLKAMATSLLNGTMTVGQYRLALKALPANQQALAAGFDATVKQMNSFNSSLTGNTPAMKTANAWLKQMTGGAVGLNTALMLTGGNAALTAHDVAAVGDAGKKSGKDIATWADVSKTFSVQMGRIRADVDSLMISLGNRLMPVVTKVFGWLADHTSVVYGLAAAIGGVLTAAVLTFAVTTAAAAAPVLLLLSPLMLLGGAALYAYKHMATFRTQVSGWGNDIKKIAKTASADLAQFSAGFDGKSSAKGPFARWGAEARTEVAEVAADIPKMIAGVKALFGGLEGNSGGGGMGKLGREVRGLVEYLAQKVPPAVAAIVAAFKASVPYVRDIASAIGPIIALIAAILVPLLQTIAPILRNCRPEIEVLGALLLTAFAGRKLLGGVAGFFSFVKGGIGGIKRDWATVTSLFSRGGKAAAANEQLAFRYVEDEQPGRLSRAGSAVKNRLPSFLGGYGGEHRGPGVFSRAGTAVKDFGTAAAEKAALAFKLTMDGLRVAGKATTEALAAGWSKVSSVLTVAKARLVLTRIATLAQAAASRVAAAAQWLWDAAMDANPIALIVIGIAALVAGVIYAYLHFKTFREVVQDAFRGIVVAFKWVADAAGSLFGWVKTHWPLLLAIITGPIGLAVYGMIKYWGAIKNVFVGAFDWFRDIGKHIVNGIVKGIEDMASAPVNAIKNVGKGILNGAKSVLGIFSPSRVMADQVGQWIPRGVAKGILDNVSAIHPATAAMAKAATGGIYNSPTWASGSGLPLASSRDGMNAPSTGTRTIHLEPHYTFAAGTTAADSGAIRAQVEAGHAELLAELERAMRQYA